MSLCNFSGALASGGQLACPDKVSGGEVRVTDGAFDMLAKAEAHAAVEAVADLVTTLA